MNCKDSVEISHTSNQHSQHFDTAVLALFFMKMLLNTHVPRYRRSKIHLYLYKNLVDECEFLRYCAQSTHAHTYYTACNDSVAEMLKLMRMRTHKEDGEWAIYSNVILCYIVVLSVLYLFYH